MHLFLSQASWHYFATGSKPSTNSDCTVPTLWLHIGPPAFISSFFLRLETLKGLCLFPKEVDLATALGSGLSECRSDGGLIKHRGLAWTIPSSLFLVFLFLMKPPSLPKILGLSFFPFFSLPTSPALLGRSNGTRELVDPNLDLCCFVGDAVALIVLGWLRKAKRA